MYSGVYIVDSRSNRGSKKKKKLVRIFFECSAVAIIVSPGLSDNTQDNVSRTFPKIQQKYYFQNSNTVRNVPYGKVSPSPYGHCQSEKF